MVIQVKDASPVTINIPKASCTIEDSGNGNRISVLEYPDVTSPKRHNAEAAEKTPEARKAAAKKKFDKILPCPHCNRIERKFFYLSKYNVSQTRHFCRSCQRYWTLGGSKENHFLRVSPSKSKHPSSYLQPGTESLNEFGFVESRKFREASSVACRGRTRVPSSSFSSMRKSNVQDTLQGFPNPPHPRNIGWIGESLLVPWNSLTTEMIPGICIPNINIPPAPVTPSNRSSPLHSAGHSDCFRSTLPSVRKHSRDLKLLNNEKKNEMCLCLPKTLRIVIDPEEAAKSSIWNTLGTKSGKKDPIRNGCMFEEFQFRPEENAEKSEVEKTLEANPVALSRSQRFHESCT